MKRILLSALLLSGLMLAVAQVKKEDLATKNTASPGAETSVTINGKNIWIYYHAPSVRGRHIFGGAGALHGSTTTPPPSGVATFSAAPARSSRMAAYGVWAPITPLFCTPTPTST